MTKYKLVLKKKNLLLILLVVIFLFASVKLFCFFFDTHKNNQESKDLIDEVFLEVPDEDNVGGSKIIIDFNKLLEKNKDTKGWINYNDNKINYPIVQGKDNNYYLTRSFSKTYNQAGAIFMDYRNNSFEDKNIVLYGHSMLDGSMFASLKDLFENDFFEAEDHNIIEIRDLNNNILKYQIFSYYIIEREEYYITTSFKTDKEYLDFLNIIKGRSYKKFNIDLDINDRILTLSTCSGVEGTTRRKVVHAKLLSND